MIWLFLLAGAAACPYAFQHYWTRRWFQVLWWIALVVLVGGALRSIG